MMDENRNRRLSAKDVRNCWACSVMLKPRSFLEALKIELSSEQSQGDFAAVQFLVWTNRALSTTEEEEEKNEAVVDFFTTSLLQMPYELDVS